MTLVKVRCDLFAQCSLYLPRTFGSSRDFYPQHSQQTARYDDVIKWKHFPRYWPVVRGINWSPVNSPHKVQWNRALMFSLICSLNKRLSKQSWGWWFVTPSRLLWRYCNELAHEGEVNFRCPQWLTCALVQYSTTICKLVDLIPALRQSDCRIPNWVSAKTVLSCSTNHGQTTARFRSFFR